MSNQSKPNIDSMPDVIYVWKPEILYGEFTETSRQMNSTAVKYIHEDFVPSAPTGDKAKRGVEQIGGMMVFSKRQKALKNFKERAEKCGNAKEDWCDIQGVEVETVETIRAALQENTAPDSNG
ncbi:hypothetical protein Dfri01_55780 [Dyadobacter frigoris]|uniref:hypothetical protein n=1 Tax=Dyadobacter frigoris TaxID=2576211 RepID=UPI0024A570FB|nr:hypothetical protein [Dyadobacter frigoris]GLU56117.1 hypothetical protein Dfri01_55780 [Dyadobacter frigoris]